MVEKAPSRQHFPNRPPSYRDSLPSSTPTSTACNPTGAQPTFSLQVVSGSSADGSYLSVSNTQVDDFITLSGDPTQATSFTFDSACHLVDLTNGEIAGINQNSTSGGTLYFNTAAYSALNGYVPAVCDLVSGGLSCAVANTAQVIVYCSDVSEVAWGDSLASLEGEDSTCVQIGLVAVS